MWVSLPFLLILHVRQEALQQTLEPSKHATHESHEHSKRLTEVGFHVVSLCVINNCCDREMTGNLVMIKSH